MADNREYVQLAATRDPATGVVKTAGRHAELQPLKGLEQGFTTNVGRFVDRSEAADIALAAGQIDGHTVILTDEDVIEVFYTMYCLKCHLSAPQRDPAIARCPKCGGEVMR